MFLIENGFQVSMKVFYLSKVNYKVDNIVSKGWDVIIIIMENIVCGKCVLWFSYLGISYIIYKEEVGNDKSKCQSDKKNCFFNFCGFKLIFEGVVYFIFQFFGVFDLESFEQRNVDVSYKYVWKNILKWKKYECYFKWIEMFVIFINNGKMSVVKIYFVFVICCGGK